MRLADSTSRQLQARADLTHIAERTLAQRYIDEGLRRDAHPLITFLDGPSGRRATIAGRGLDVWEVIATLRDNAGSVEKSAAYLEVPTGLVQAAFAYYGDYRGEIDAEIAANEAAFERGFAGAATRIGESGARSR